MSSTAQRFILPSQKLNSSINIHERAQHYRRAPVTTANTPPIIAASVVNPPQAYTDEEPLVLVLPLAASSSNTGAIVATMTEVGLPVGAAVGAAVRAALVGATEGRKLPLAEGAPVAPEGALVSAGVVAAGGLVPSIESGLALGEGAMEAGEGAIVVVEGAPAGGSVPLMEPGVTLGVGVVGAGEGAIVVVVGGAATGGSVLSMESGVALGVGVVGAGGEDASPSQPQLKDSTAAVAGLVSRTPSPSRSPGGRGKVERLTIIRGLTS